MAKKSIEPTKVNKTWEEKTLLYDYDYNYNQSWFKVRILIKEGKDNFITPVTPLYAARFVDTTGIRVPAKNGLELRQLTLCYPNPNNKTGKTELTVYVPYSPDKPEWKEQIQETFNFSDALSITYKGESKNTEYTTSLN